MRTTFSTSLRSGASRGGMMRESEFQGDDVSTTNEVTEAASLADAVLDAGGRAPGGPATDRGGPLRRRPPARRRRRASSRCSRACRSAGRFTFVMLALLQLRRRARGRRRSAVLAPDIRDSFGVSDGVIVFITAASGAFLVLGALPMGWLADRYRRPPIIGWAPPCLRRVRVPVRPGGQRVPAVPGPLRRRGRQVEHHPGARLADRRHLPDRRPRPDQRRRRWARGRLVGALSPVARRRHRRARRRRRRLALGVLPPRHPGRSRSRSSRSASPSRRGASSRRRTCSARSSRTTSRRRSRSRPRSPGSGRSARSSTVHPRLRGAWASACSPGRCCRTSSSRTSSASTRSSAGVLGTVGGLGVLVASCRSSAERYDALFRRGPGQGAAARRAADPARRASLMPIQYFMPNAVAVRDRRHVPQRPAVDRVHDGRAGPAVGRAVPAARAWARRSARSTSSSSAPPAARCSPRFFTDAFGPRAAVLLLVRPVARSSAAS